MKNKNYKIKQRYIIFLMTVFIIFMIGFISVLLVLLRESNVMTSSLLENPIEGIHELTLFGINVMKFDVTEMKNGAFDLVITKSKYYNVLPFIAGGALVTVSLIISAITKRLLLKMKEGRDSYGDIWAYSK